MRFARFLGKGLAVPTLKRYTVGMTQQNMRALAGAKREELRRHVVQAGSQGKSGLKALEKQTRVNQVTIFRAVVGLELTEGTRFLLQSFLESNPFPAQRGNSTSATGGKR
jgi:hypothetical protein